MARPAEPSEVDRTIEDLLDARPAAARVLLRHGMACVGCAMARFETLAEAAAAYRVDLPTIVRELRALPADDGHGRRRRRA